MTVIQLVRAKTWGGGEQYALDLSRRLTADRHSVIIVSKGVDALDSRFRDAGAEVTNLPLGGVLDFVSPRRLAKIINSLPDPHVIVHVHTFKDAEIAARARRYLSPGKSFRLITTRHLVKPGKCSRRWKFIYDNIDSLIFVSDFAKKEFLASTPPVSAEKISVIHNSILPRAGGRPEVPARQFDSAGTFSILFTGRITAEKGLEDLFAALSMLKDISLRLRIAGTGEESYIRSLKDLSERLGINSRVEWLGFCQDVYNEIRKADICVAPSVARESFGLILIEFMSQGKAVIATDNGAQPEIITSGVDGLLVPPHNPEALAEAIRLLATAPGLRDRIAKKAEATFSSRFSYPIFYSRILSIYRNA